MARGSLRLARAGTSLTSSGGNVRTLAQYASPLALAAGLALSLGWSLPATAQQRSGTFSAPSRFEAANDPNNWPMYDGWYNGWRYSGLSEINRSNVKKLKVAWIHQPGAITQ